MNPVLPADILVPLLAAFAAVIVAAAWRSTAALDRRLRAAVVALRAGAVAGLAVIAINPGQWRTVVRRQDSAWAMLVDRSASMATPDCGGARRWDAALALARRAAAAEPDPARMRVYTFAADLDRALGGPAALAGLAPDGDGTDVVGPAAALLDRFAGVRRGLAGVILFSDGRDLAGGASGELAVRARAMDAPLYAAALGGPVPRRDLSVSAVRRHCVTFAGQDVAVAARVVNQGLGDLRTAVRLLKPDGTEAASREILAPDGSEQTVEFPYRPPGEGYEVLRIAAPAWPGEAAARNNEAEVGVLSLSAKIRVLFLEGSPHWDSKFLTQLLRRQPHVGVDSVHRVREERFFRVDAAGGREEDTETVFPADADALAQYDAVAFGKGAEYFLTPERAAMLHAFVRDHGGAVLFCRGKPYYGALPALDPLDAGEWGAPVRGAFRWQPAAAGEQAGLFGAALPGREAAVWLRLQPLEQAMACPSLKPFSQVLVEGVPLEPGGRPFPALIGRRVGRGIVVAVNTEGLWRFDFFPSDAEVSALYKEFWVELFQWAVTQAEFLPGERIAVRVAPSSVRPGEAVKAVVSLRGGEAVRRGDIELAISRGEEAVRTLALQPGGGGETDRAAVFSLPEPGLYRVSARAGGTGAAASATIEVRPPPAEADELSADPAFLRRLAEASGGRLIGGDEIEAVVRSFAPREEVDEGAPVWEPRWDRGWGLLLLAGAFAAEWLLRRRNGLL